MPWAHQIASNSRGGYLKIVGLADWISFVKNLIKSSAQIFAVIDGDSAFLINEQAQIPGSALFSKRTSQSCSPISSTTGCASWVTISTVFGFFDVAKNDSLPFLMCRFYLLCSKNLCPNKTKERATPLFPYDSLLLGAKSFPIRKSSRLSSLIYHTFETFASPPNPFLP